MSYLTLKQNLSNTDKVIISLWFRIPAKTVANVRSLTPDHAAGYRIYNGVVPLISWGASQEVTISEIVNHDTGVVNLDRSPIVVQEVVISRVVPIGPSYLGVLVGGNGWPCEPPGLSVNIQTNVQADGTGLAFINTGWSGDLVGYDSVTGKPIYYPVEYTSEDVSDQIGTERPDYFGNTDFSYGENNFPKVAADHWHHLLISWSLNSITNGIGSVCKMWCALDDVNMKGTSLPAYNDMTAADPTMGPNDHTSGLCFNWLGRDPDRTVALTILGDSISFDPTEIPAPPSIEYSTDESGGVASKNSVFNVELAELQIWTNKTVDTSDLAIRRLFVDAKGKPVPPTQKANPTTGTGPGSIEVLGKPAILLHKSGNWTHGKNTGTLGQDAHGKPILSGQFTPTGKIPAWKPDPSLHGPQSPKKAAVM